MAVTLELVDPSTNRYLSGRFAPVHREITTTDVEIDPAAGTVETSELRVIMSEFPRIDDRLLGRKHRYVTVGAASGKAVTTGEHDRLCRVDLQTSEWVEFDTGAAIGEVVFAPRAGATGELDGYYLTFATSLADDRSGLYIWDAADFSGEPVAKVLVPQRIPNGLHGNWFAA